MAGTAGVNPARFARGSASGLDTIGAAPVRAIYFPPRHHAATTLRFNLTLRPANAASRSSQAAGNPRADLTPSRRNAQITDPRKLLCR